VVAVSFHCRPGHQPGQHGYSDPVSGAHRLQQDGARAVPILYRHVGLIPELQRPSLGLGSPWTPGASWLHSARCSACTSSGSCRSTVLDCRCVLGWPAQWRHAARRGDGPGPTSLPAAVHTRLKEPNWKGREGRRIRWLVAHPTFVRCAGRLARPQNHRDDTVAIAVRRLTRQDRWGFCLPTYVGGYVASA